MSGCARRLAGPCLVLGLPLILGCSVAPRPPGQPVEEEAMQAARRQMVERQIESRGIRDPAVLAAMRSVPRDRFVPESERAYAYGDGPLPIGQEQTISQPYIVALMTELIRPQPGMRVLEVGTGSGYQAAVLSRCVGRVYTIEILPELSRRAEQLLDELGYDNVTFRTGDGYDGWPDEAPFDAIIVTAAPASVPQPLLDQLAVGGRLVIPVGRLNQDLLVVTRTEDGFEREPITGVRFVPMTGKAEG
jgi:protein-L-isoaspartate(D-aspartate) O-methyltransferase